VITSEDGTVLATDSLLLDRAPDRERPGRETERERGSGGERERGREGESDRQRERYAECSDLHADVRGQFEGGFGGDGLPGAQRPT